MKIIYRMALTPLVFIYGVFILAAGTIFPVTLIVMMSFIGLLFYPFVSLFRAAGGDIGESMFDEPFIHEVEEECGTWIAHLAGATVHIWGAFYISWLWLVKGELFKLE